MTEKRIEPCDLPGHAYCCCSYCFQGKMRKGVADQVQHILRKHGLSDDERREAFDIWADFNLPLTMELGYQVEISQRLEELEWKIMKRIESERK